MIAGMIEKVERDLGKRRRVSLEASGPRQVLDSGSSSEQTIDLGAEQGNLGTQDLLWCFEIGSCDELLGRIDPARRDLLSRCVDQYRCSPLITARIRLHQVTGDLDRVGAPAGQDLRSIGVSSGSPRRRHLCVHTVAFERILEREGALPTEHSDVGERIRQSSCLLAIDAGDGSGDTKVGRAENCHRLHQIHACWPTWSIPARSLNVRRVVRSRLPSAVLSAAFPRCGTRRGRRACGRSGADCRP